METVIGSVPAAHIGKVIHSFVSAREAAFMERHLWEQRNCPEPFPPPRPSANMGPPAEIRAVPTFAN